MEAGEGLHESAGRRSPKSDGAGEIDNPAGCNRADTASG